MRDRGRSPVASALLALLAAIAAFAASGWQVLLGRGGPELRWPSWRRDLVVIALAALLFLALGGALTGALDEAVGLRGQAHDTAETQAAAAAFGEPGAPPLLPWERVPAELRGVLAAFGAPPPAREVAPGLRIVDYVDECSTVPKARHERSSGAPLHLTVHTTEEESALGYRAVCRYHSQDLAWGRAGYHFYVAKDGTIYQLLDEGVKPYAQKLHNDRDLAIALQGRANRGVPTEAQLSALHRLVRWLALRYPTVTPEGIYGHRDWTRLDQAALRAGTWAHDVGLANDHLDPGDNWDGGRYGLSDAVRAVRGAAGVPPIDQTPGTTVSGSATYYGAYYEGRRTASGEVYRRGALTTAIYRIGDAPALPYGTWLRVCVRDGGRCVPVRVNDTGSFLPPRQVLDLSERAFRELAPLERGRIEVDATVLGQDGPDRAFYPCYYSPVQGGWVYGDDLAFYRRGANGQTGSAVYGCPVDYEPWLADDGQTWVQRFSRGVMKWSPQRGTWFERG